MNKLNELCDTYHKKRSSHLRRTWLSFGLLNKRFSFNEDERFECFKQLRKMDSSFLREIQNDFILEVTKIGYTDTQLKDFLVNYKNHNSILTSRFDFLALFSATISFLLLSAKFYALGGIASTIFFVFGLLAVSERSELQKIKCGNEELIAIIEREIEQTTYS